MRISVGVAISFAFMLMAIVGASAAVAVVEPGAERVVAALIGGAGFILVVLGMLKPGDWASPARRFLGWVSSTSMRVIASVVAMIAIGVGVLLIGPCRIYHE